MKNKNQFKAMFTGFAAVAIPVIFVVALLLYIYVLGNPSNFDGGNTNNHPLPGNYLGIIYKGGIIVPILLTLLMMVLTFAIERFITINKAKGKGSISSFVAKVHTKVAQQDLDSAIAECDKQRGSVANVVRAGILKYKEMVVINYVF